MDIAMTERVDQVRKVKLFRLMDGFEYQEKTIAVSATISHNWAKDLAEGWVSSSQFGVIRSQLAQEPVLRGSQAAPSQWADERRAQHEIENETQKQDNAVDVQSIVNQAVASALAARIYAPAYPHVPAETQLTVPIGEPEAPSPKRRGRKPKSKGGDLSIG